MTNIEVQDLFAALPACQRLRGWHSLCRDIPTIWSTLQDRIAISTLINSQILCPQCAPSIGLNTKKGREHKVPGKF